MKFSKIPSTTSQAAEHLLNSEKVLGSLRGILLMPFLAKCGFPVVIEQGVKFTNPKAVELGNWVRIRHATQILHDVQLGNRVFIGRYCDIGNNTVIEDDVTLADYVCILGDTHDYSDPTRRAGKLIPVEQKRIGSGAWIGYRAIILPQVRHIGKGAVVGAGAVVTRDVPAHSIVVGNPAKVIANL